MRPIAITAFILGVLALPLAGTAAVFNPAQVAADATWVVHVDVDALRASTFFQKAYAKAIESDRRVREGLDRVRKDLGLDVEKDLHGVTVYGRRLRSNEGVLLFNAAIDAKDLAAKAKYLPDYTSIAHGKHEIHRWTDAKGKSGEHAVHAVFYASDLVVFAVQAEELKTALDVLDGASPGLAKTSPLAVASPLGTGFTLRAAALAEAELPFKSPLVTQSESLRVSAGEHEGEVFFEASLGMRTAETAAQVKAIVDGLRAMVELQQGQDAMAIELIRAMQIIQQDKMVHVKFRAPAAALWAMFERQWDRRKR